MNIVLLDTNIVSFMFKSDSRAQAYAPYVQGQRLAISFMTVAELYQWAAVHRWGNRRIRKLEQILQTTYTILTFDVALCQQWGEVRAMRRAMGRPISSEDAWIAATALQYNLPLITHNPKDFGGIPTLEIITTVV